jgi:uncharacterized protein Yka (UPF0111/DUF47 family)
MLRTGIVGNVLGNEIGGIWQRNCSQKWFSEHNADGLSRADRVDKLEEQTDVPDDKTRNKLCMSFTTPL